MPSIPKQVATLLQDLTTHLPTILGKNLVGIYLYGSLTQRAFNPQCSDGTTDHWPVALIALENELGAQARKFVAKWGKIR